MSCNPKRGRGKMVAGRDGVSWGEASKAQIVGVKRFLSLFSL